MNKISFSFNFSLKSGIDEDNVRFDCLSQQIIHFLLIHPFPPKHTYAHICMYTHRHTHTHTRTHTHSLIHSQNKHPVVLSDFVLRLCSCKHVYLHTHMIFKVTFIMSPDQYYEPHTNFRGNQHMRNAFIINFTLAHLQETTRRYRG